MMKAEIVTIGDEILIGQIIDTNSAWIAQQLQELDLPVVQISSIADTATAIGQTLKDAGARADVILITGGLGPTADDVTKVTAARFFETTLVRNQEVLEHVTRFFESRNLPMLDSNRQQADVLASGEVLFNDHGTAPGMLVEQDGKTYIFMPGVPFEMKHIMKKHVLPRLKNKQKDAYLIHENIIIGGIGESYLAEKIKDIETELPDNIKLAYLPTLAFIRLRLSGKGKNHSDLALQVSLFKTKLISRLNEYVIADYDTSVQEYLVRQFIRHTLTLTTAESCTGGSLAALFTAVAGCSEMFIGGTIPYSNHLKQQLLGVKEETLATHGAVSEETVVEMAEGAKNLYGADYAIATSGIAGPGGGTPDKPVGTIWISVAGRKKTIAQKFQFKNDRAVNLERTRLQALLMLWRLFTKELTVG